VRGIFIEEATEDAMLTLQALAANGHIVECRGMELCNTSASTARSTCVAELSTFLLGAGVHSYFGCSG